MATEDPIGLVDAPAGVAAVNPFEEEQEAHSPDEAPIVPESPLDIRIIALVHRPNPLTTSSSPSTPCPQPSPLPSADVPHKLHHRSHSEIPATKAESEDHDLLLFNEFINSCKNTNSTGSSDNEAEIKANEKLNPKGGERYHHHFGDETSKAVLEALEPHHSLKELLISKYNGVTSPTWMVNWCLSGLQSLTLDSCDSWEILPTLGQLQKRGFIVSKCYTCMHCSLFVWTPFLPLLRSLLCLTVLLSIPYRLMASYLPHSRNYIFLAVQN